MMVWKNTQARTGVSEKALLPVSAIYVALIQGGRKGVQGYHKGDLLGRKPGRVPDTSFRKLG